MTPPTAPIPPLVYAHYPLDHVGIAVRDLAAALNTYTALWGYKVVAEETVAEQQVQLAFLDTGAGLLEILSPLEATSKLTTFLEKRGEGLHHLCFRVPDILAELRRLKAAEVPLIDTTPRHGALNSKIAFLHPKAHHGVLIELCERKL